MKCKDCKKYPFCRKINKPSDEMCKDGIKNTKGDMKDAN